ncbi:MAG: RHS repeat-associated core domain-containing protein [Burkholderiaceae bacterium]|nr:MAG: RHS repeat-associated core domain-containing protein [Burkholderiaceae bacterium]
MTGFGETPPTTGAEGYAQPGATGLQSYAEPVLFELRYPGQQWDAETQLAYNLHRYYDASTGRYVQADPIGLEGGWNRFGYVEGNPLGFTDSIGLMTECRWMGAVLICGNSRPPVDPELPPPPPVTFPNPFKPIKDFIDWCIPSHEKNCEALRQSILNTCEGLSGSSKRRCFAAADESYRQCMSEK